MPTVRHDQRSSRPTDPAPDAELRDAAGWLLRAFSEMSVRAAAPSVASSMVDRRGVLATAGTIVERALKLTWKWSGVEQITRRPASSVEKIEDLLSGLERHGALPEHVVGHVRTVQIWRNFGAHDKSDIRKVTPVTIQMVVDNVGEFVQWVIDTHAAETWTPVGRAMVARETPLAMLIDEDEHQVYPFRGVIVLGRDPECGVAFPDARLSRRHCVIEWVDGGYEVVDLGSTNGTYVNGTRFAERWRLSEADVVTMGDRSLRFRLVTSFRAQGGRAGNIATVPSVQAPTPRR